MAGKIWTVSQMKSGFYKAGKACSDPSDCLPAFMCARGAGQGQHGTPISPPQAPQTRLGGAGERLRGLARGGWWAWLLLGSAGGQIHPAQSCVGVGVLLRTPL